LITVTPQPQPKFLERITVYSISRNGFRYTVKEAGTYYFQYVVGAFAAWPLAQGTPEEPRWSTEVVAFNGITALFNGQAMETDKALFRIGARGYTSQEAAEKDSVGVKAYVSLQAGEEITLVVLDGRTDYDDNSGNITLDIYFAPS
jgi:hypothetical protein